MGGAVGPETAAAGPSARRRGRLLKAWLLRGAQIVLTVLVTWFILSRVGLGLDDLRAVDPALWTPEPVLFAASCLVLFGGYVMSAVLWARIVDDMGGPRIPASRAVRIFMIANLGRYVPGKVWQIAGLAVLARREGVAAGTATGAAVAGQGVALGAATLVGLAAVLASTGVSGPGMAVGAGLLLVAVAVALVPAVFRRLTALWFRLAREEAPGTLTSADGARWLALYTLNWALYAVSFWVMVASLGLDVGVVTAGSAFAAAYVLGYVMIFAPAGVGVREGFLVALLTPHVGAAPSGAVAILARLWTTGVEVVPAAAFWLRHVAAGTAERNPEDGR